MRYRRMPIEVESPEQFGYDRIRRNLAESSVRDGVLGDIADDLPGRLAGLVLAYGDHLGIPELRARIADDWGVDADEVLVTPGAAAALFLVHTALLHPGDHLVVMRPNYATNLETPRAIGAEVTFVDTRWEDGWRLDHERVAAAMTERTALVSVTTPGNPTGRMLRPEDLEALVALVEAHPRARLLVDETYRDLSWLPPTTPAAARSTRAIGVSSLSKAYGLPGIRVGWLATRDPGVRETLLAAKEQVVIAGSVLDETVALAALERRGAWLPRLREGAAAGRAAVEAWIGDSPFEWIAPDGGAVGFPRLRPDLDVAPDDFYRILFQEHGTVVGPGHWFEQPSAHFRLGFGWPSPRELAEGLAALRDAAEAARRA
jgi:aspartate/methionine/tyrosine aminotransferase